MDFYRLFLWNIRSIIGFFIILSSCLTANLPTDTTYCPLCHRSCPDSVLDHLLFSSELLFFRTCEDGLAFGTQVDSSTVSNSVDIHSKVKNIRPRWSVGYRLGLSYPDPCNDWMADILWTHFNSHSHRTFANPAVLDGARRSFFVPAYGSEAFNITEPTHIDRTFARWKVHIDLLDLELGKRIPLCSCISIRAHAGIRAAWIRQTYNIINSSIMASIARDLQSVRLRTHYEGIGLRTGLDVDWNIGCGLSLYSKAAIAALCGNFKVKSEDLFFLGGPIEGLPVEDEQKDDILTCNAVADGAVGIAWEGCFCERYFIRFNFGWEGHLFFNHNRFEDFVKLSTPPVSGEMKNPQYEKGDLCLQGFVLGAQIDF